MSFMRSGFIVQCAPMKSDPGVRVIVVRGDDGFELAASIPPEQKAKIGDRVSVTFDFKESIRE